MKIRFLRRLFHRRPKPFLTGKNCYAYLGKHGDYSFIYNDGDSSSDEVGTFDVGSWHRDKIAARHYCEKLVGECNAGTNPLKSTRK